MQSLHRKAGREVAVVPRLRVTQHVSCWQRRQHEQGGKQQQERQPNQADLRHPKKQQVPLQSQHVPVGGALCVLGLQLVLPK